MTGLRASCDWFCTCFWDRVDFSIDPSYSRFKQPLTGGRTPALAKSARSSHDFESELVNIPSKQLAARNNNPGNLRYAEQPGATRGAKGFARFETAKAGYESLVRQVKLDAGRDATVAQYINKYAPPCENDTGLYIKQACQALGVAGDTPLSSVDPRKMAEFQARKESGTIVCRSDGSPTRGAPVIMNPSVVERTVQDRTASLLEANKQMLARHVLSAYGQNDDVRETQTPLIASILSSIGLFSPRGL